MTERPLGDGKGSIVEVAPTPLGIPMMPIEELKKLTAYVNLVKKTLMVEGKDYVVDGKRQYTARSGFAKLLQGFNLSDEEPIVTKLWNEDMIGEEKKEYTFKHFIHRRERTETFSTKLFGFEARVKVINLETGRFTWGEGACTVDELNWTGNLSPKWYHRALGTAKTRAWNRAISNYVGSAEVSAEEMGLVYSDDDPPPASSPPARRKAESEVNIVDFMTPKGITPPSWLPADEINRETQDKENQWDSAQKIVETWMSEGGLLIEAFEIKVRAKVITVRPKKAIPANKKAGVNGLMIGGGFIPAKIVNVDGWRLNKKAVTG